MAKQPMYQKIAEDIRGQIESGELARGAQLSTEEALGAKYEASRNTVRDAIKRLTVQGFLETRPGQGTFVMHEIDPFVTVLNTEASTGFGGGDGAQYLSQVRAGHREPRATVPEVKVEKPPEEVTSRLRLPPGSQVVSRYQERYIDEIPWQRQKTFYLWEFIEKGATMLLTATDIEEGAVRYLADTIGVRQIGYRDWITARLPDGDEQRFFSVGHDATMFVIFRTAFDENKKPMRLTVTVSPADRNQFIVNVGEGLPEPQYDKVPGRAL
jgi:GntR family transcriptional regulator